MPRVLASLLTLSALMLAAPTSAEEFQVINLYDAFGKDTRRTKGTQKDFGLSLLIKYKGKTILFDSGTNSDILEKNTKALNIDLRKVDFAIASHAHADHTGGFHYLLKVNPKVKIYFPHDFFGAHAPLTFNAAGKEPKVGKKLPKAQQYFGGKTTTAHVHSNGLHYKSVIYVKKHKKLAPGIHLIATKSPYMGYFTSYPGVDLHGKPTKDTGKAKMLPLPELSLSLATPKGEVLIVGCSHSTVEAIVTATKRVRKRGIYMLAGGYHLLPYDRKTIVGIASRLKTQLKVQHVAPAHCTGHLAFQILRAAYGKNYHLFGLGSVLSE